MGLKLYFSQQKTYFSQVIDKFLKFQEITCLNDHVQFEMWAALCKFSLFFSNVTSN